jgi:hypothetical protein
MPQRRKFRKKTRKYGQTRAKDKSGTNTWFRSNNIYLIDPFILKKIPNELMKLTSEFFSPDDWDRSTNDKTLLAEATDDKKNKGGSKKGGKKEGNKGGSRKGNNKMSKKDQIIKANTERMQKETIDNEFSSLKNSNNPFDVKVKTDIGKFCKALKCLKIKYKEKDIPGMLDVYLCFMDLFNKYNEEIKKFNKKNIDKCKNLFVKKFYSYKNTIKKVNKIYDEQNIIKYQLQEMGSYLGTLNFLNYSVNRDIKLDEWQIKFLNLIDKERSVLLCAPTSSGKTFLTNYLIKKSKRILFIVPTMPLALQVASMFTQHVSGGVWIINETILSFNDNPSFFPRVIIGTPQELLFRIDQLGVSGIDTVVIDEIHEINNNDAIEPLIHIMSKQPKFKKFLGLSATIGNPVQFHKWLKTLIPNMEKIVVNERFFNLSRYVYSDNKLVGISPFNIMDYDLFMQNIDKFTDYPFTPHEVLKLSEDMLSTGFKIMNCNEFFEGLIQISLKDTKNYCNYLFENLKNPENNKLLKLCFNKYKFDDLDLTKCKISNLCNYLSKNKFVPAIIFHLNNITLKKYFDELLQYMENAEYDKYPDHQENIVNKYEKFKNKCDEIDKRLDKINRDEKKREYLEDNPYPDPPTPIGSPHDEFKFTMNGVGTNFNEVNEIRNSLVKYFKKKRMDGQVPKLNELFNALLRGFAIYCADLPIQYLLFVQELMQKGRIPFVFSDGSLAVGANMPFKNSIFFEDCPQLTPLRAQQMEGRAGRRGLDRTGNVIFVNFTEERIKYLLNTHIEDIQSSESALKNNMMALPSSIMNRDKIINSIFKNNVMKITDRDMEIEQKKLDKIRFKKLYWNLSRFKESYNFCYFLGWFIGQSKLHQRISDNSDVECFKLFSMVLNLDFDGKSTMMKWDESNEVIQSCLKHMYDNEFIDFDHKNIDSTLFLIFQKNKVPDEIKENDHLFSQVKYGLERIRHLLSETRNFLKTTTAEVIIRKMERRLKWLQIQQMYIY